MTSIAHIILSEDCIQMLPNCPIGNRILIDGDPSFFDINLIDFNSNQSTSLNGTITPFQMIIYPTGYKTLSIESYVYPDLTLHKNFSPWGPF